MELDVIAVGFGGYVASLWAFIWLSRRAKRPARTGPPPLPKWARTLEREAKQR